MFKRQSGFALGAYLTFMATAISLIFLSYMAVQGRIKANNDMRVRQAYINEVSTKIGAWYKANLRTIDTGSNPTEAVIISGSGITVKNGLRVKSSDLITSGEIKYRIFGIWIPDVTPDTTAFNLVSGVITPPVPLHSYVYTYYNGLVDEIEAYTLTQKRLDRLAIVLQSFSTAKMLNNGESDIGINRFRPDICPSAAIAGQIPCLDTYTDLNIPEIRLATGLSSTELTDAWGDNFFGSNLVDSSTVSPPYSMAIKVTTPFGFIYRKIAIQPIQ